MPNKLKNYIIGLLLFNAIVINLYFWASNTSMVRYLPTEDNIVGDELQLCYITMPNNRKYKKFRYCETNNHGVTLCNFLSFGFDDIRWEKAKFYCKQ
jgi:hypothetical protein